MKQRIQHFPFAFSAVILGFAGCTLLLQKISHHFSWSNIFWQLLFGLSALLFLAFLFFAIKKIWLFAQEVKKDLLHPVKGNFFAIPAKIFLIFSLIVFPFSPDISLGFFVIGSIWQIVITFFILSLWIRKDIFHPKHLSPAWFLPIVGNLIVPIAGVPLGFEDISWFFFSVGFFFWLLLFAIIFNRIVFHEPMAEKFLPTLFILFAPPAIACIALGKLLGEFTPFSLILLHFSIFLFVFVLLQFSLFQKISFYLSWWAYSFPIAAVGLALFYTFEQTHNDFFLAFSVCMLALLVAIIVYLSKKTLSAIAQKKICIEE
jgi:tellurite resistance protein